MLIRQGVRIDPRDPNYQRHLAAERLRQEGQKPLAKGEVSTSEESIQRVEPVKKTKPVKVKTKKK